MDRAKLISDGEITPEQFNKLTSLKAMCLEETHSIFKDNPAMIPRYTDDDHLLRLLIAREWVVKKSFEMWKKWVDWRISYKADSIKEEEIEAELMKGKAYYHGFDRQKHPILVVHTRRHFPKDSNEEMIVRHGIYLLEEGIRLSEQNSEDGKITVIWDRKGFTRKNYDKRMLALLKKLVAIIQDNYAERLYKLIILYPNLLFRTIFAVIKPFLNQRTKNKILIVTNLDQLTKEVSAENLLMEHGGNSTFVYSFKGKYVTDDFSGKPIEREIKEEEEKGDEDIIKEINDENNL